MRHRYLVLAFVATFVVALPGGTAAAKTASDTPTVTGPVTGGKGVPTLISTIFEPASVGYVYEEYFLEGTATSYTPTKPFGPNGKWKVKAADAAPYKTRIVVWRPESAKSFDGTVFVEWLNVSAGFDTGPDWLSAHNQILRSGAAYIGVSAQEVGVQGGQGLVASEPSGGLKLSDPERYGTLSHPGDVYSYDIFSQTGVVARGKADLDPLGDLKVKRVIATGESQSAFRMVTYVNAVHPLAGVFDGFLVHSRGASGASIGESPARGEDDPSMPETAAIRSDTDVPVLTFQTETDLTRLGYLPARQKDSKRFRLWEVAGTSHADAYTAGVGFSDTGDGKAEQTLLAPDVVGGGVLNCSAPINTGPAFAVLNAGLDHLERWVRSGKAPPKSPRFEATSDPEPALVRDEHGNVKGGIRTGPLDVPLATVDGESNEGGSFCGLFGNTKRFDAATIAQLYPSHDDYVTKFDAATDKAVKAGFLLEDEATNYKNAAAAIDIGVP
jgi:hypothetical protein